MKKIAIYIGANPSESPEAGKEATPGFRLIVHSNEEGRLSGTPALSDRMLNSHDPVPAHIVCCNSDIPAAVREMEANGIAYASCTQCEIFNACGKADWNDYANRACCRSADICEVYDCEQPRSSRAAEFVLLDKALLYDEDALLSRLKKYFPALAVVQVPLFVPSPTSVLPK